MCGIAGLIGLDGAPPQAEDILKMCAAIGHRGPDVTGYRLYGRAALGNTRLKVIDLSSNANQPVSNEDGTIHVVFNGEIYNYRELRSELVRGGHRFRSQTDTEVLVHLYEEMGPSFVKELDGMFALAVWDERVQQLLLARDRVGKKPLFYYEGAEFLAFASEIKALIAHPRVPAEVETKLLSACLSFGYVPCPRTLYRGIHQLPPGHFAVLRGHKLRIEAFWQLQMHPSNGIRFQDACEEVRVLLRNAVKKRLVSDVPLGVLLSGGVDSSIVAALASAEVAKLKTFCAVFPEDPVFNEAEFARVVAKRFATDHHELEVRPQASDLIEKLVYHHDQPFVDSSAVPTYLISRLARQHVTVVLNGDGGDETFAGYKRFWNALMLQQIPRWASRSAGRLFSLLPLRKTRLQQRLRRLADISLRPIEERYPFYVSLFLSCLDEIVRPEIRREEVDPLFSYRAIDAGTKGLPPLGRLLFLNYREFLLNDLNVKMDRCTMANALEARSPFLDTALIEFAGRLPDSYKLHGRTRKYILKAAFQNLLPANILYRRKRGFMVPLRRWFRTDIKDLLQDMLLPRSARLYDYLQPDTVQRFVAEQLSSGFDWSDQLWLLLTLEIWLRSHATMFGRPLSTPENAASIVPVTPCEVKA
jgi:asparagine synthase (glutamine-hydrolysing)